MTVKELRDILYKPDDDAEVLIEDTPIESIMMYRDLRTGKVTVRLFT